MTQSNFQRSLDYVLAHEGGFVNHPDDPGGPTNRGITQNVLSAYLGRRALVEDVRKLSAATAGLIYRRNYWDRARCDELPSGLDYAVFDFAVNSGVAQAVKTLQRLIGVKADGIVGFITLDALRAITGPDLYELIKSYCDDRMTFLRRLKTFRKFGRGWKRRVVGEHEGVQKGDLGVVDRASLMVTGMPGVPMPVRRADGASAKALEEDESMVTSLRDPAVIGTVGSVITGVVSAGSGTGPLAYALAAVMVIVAVAVVIMIVRRRK